MHIAGLLPGLEIDYSSMPHPGCQETIDMHTFNYESIEFCDVCFIFICIPHAARRRRYYARFTICYAQFFSPTDPQKSLSYFFFAQPVTMQLSAGWSLYLLAPSTEMQNCSLCTCALACLTVRSVSLT